MTVSIDRTHTTARLNEVLADVMKNIFALYEEKSSK